MEDFRINGALAKAAYNCYLEGENYTQFFKQKTKEKYSYDWKDGNGVETDPDEPTFLESQNFSFSLIFACNSLAEFTAKYDAFITVLKVPNGSLWEFPSLGKSFRLQFLEVSDFTDIDLLAGKAKLSILLKNNY